MPGYLSTRGIAYVSASKFYVDEQLTEVNALITEVQGNVEDLQLNLGV